MKLTNKRIVGGLIALLAIVSVVQTQAIIKITKGSTSNKTVAMVSSEDQAAQVLTSAASKCIQILPRDTNYTHFIDAIDQSPSFDHTFYLGFKIKNRCNVPISIIQDVDYNFNDEFHDHFVVEDYLGVGVDTVAYAFYGYGPLKAYYDEIAASSANSTIPVANLDNVSYYSTYFTAGPIFDPSNPPSPGYIIVQNLPANSSTNFIYGVNVKGNLSAEHYSRVFLNKIRWFSTQNYNDGILSGDEIKIHNLTSEERKIVTTSHAKFNGGGVWDSRFGCPEGVVLGYNEKNSSPICSKGSGANLQSSTLR